MNVERLKSLFLFAVVGFWPLAFHLAMVTWSLLPYPRESTTASHWLTTSFIIQCLFFIALPVAAIIGAHSLFLIQKTWRRKTWVIYGTWLLVGYLMAYVLFAAIGGVSMAVVEGVASAERFFQYGIYAIAMVAVGHIVIVPWVFVASFLLKTANRKLRLWPQDAAS